MAARLKGIARTPEGWRIYVRRNHRLYSKRFPPDTSLNELKREREILIGRIHDQVHQLPRPHTFAEDAQEYLRLVTSMPSYQDRAYRIGQWVKELGSLRREHLTKLDLTRVLERWRKTGSATGGPLSPASLNQRRTALMHLYTTLDGKSAPNIVKDVKIEDERDSERTRAQPLWVCARLVKHLRSWGRLRAILHVLMWTGWPHALLKAITPGDIDWTQGRVRLGRRKKGKGMLPAWVPVVPRALLALRRFDALNCYGPFSNSSLHSAVARAVITENAWRASKQLPPLPPMRPYDFRHSFLTWAAGILKDDRALKELGRTNRIARYTEGALAQRLEHARHLLSQRRIRG